MIAFVCLRRNVLFLLSSCFVFLSKDAATNAAPSRREVNVVEMSDEGAEAAATAAVAAAGSDDEGDWEDDDEDEETTEVRFAPEEPDHRKLVLPLLVLAEVVCRVCSSF